MADDVRSRPRAQHGGSERPHHARAQRDGLGRDRPRAIRPCRQSPSSPYVELPVCSAIWQPDEACACDQPWLFVEDVLPHGCGRLISPTRHTTCRSVASSPVRTTWQIGLRLLSLPLSSRLKTRHRGYFRKNVTMKITWMRVWFCNPMPPIGLNVLGSDEIYNDIKKMTEKNHSHAQHRTPRSFHRIKMPLPLKEKRTNTEIPFALLHIMQPPSPSLFFLLFFLPNMWF
jgi:hypothetical protein